MCFAADDAQNNAQTEEAADNIDITDAITLLYSAKSAYQMPDLSPKSWDELTDRLGYYALRDVHELMFINFE